MKKDKRDNKTNKKLISAAAMFLLSAAMLGGATYAWFTMNKEVQVTGMEVKAHAEEGLLINEVKTAGSEFWDDQAIANERPDLIPLRPASTLDLETWWHANSKMSYDEAGIDDLSGTVDINTSGEKYADISPSAGLVSDYALIPAGDAQGNSKAETHVYFKDASFGNTSGTCDDGEGFYVKYTYYLKSSGDEDLEVQNLQAQVKAVKATTNPAGNSDDLDPALRVGVAIPANSSSTSSFAGVKIFAPITDADTSYDVTTNATGSASTAVSPIAGSTGDFTAYTQVNIDGTTVTPVTIPRTSEDGIPVYVYLWFEGEDTHCMSDNLTTALAAYDITINFKDADLDVY